MNTNHTGRNILLVLVALFLLAGAFSGGLIVGLLVPSTSKLETTTLSAPIPSSAESSTGAGTPTEIKALFAPFWETWQIVHDQFVEQPVDDTKLMQGAIRGMLDSLGDEHTGFMTPDEFTQATMPLEGYLYGIGVWVDTSGKLLTIISTMPGSPAEAAGLKPNDVVLAIDGKDVTGMDPNIVYKSVRGPEGTTVTLTISRKEPDEILEFSIIRAKIAIPSLESKMLDENIGYIALFQFAETTGSDLFIALKEILAQEPVGLILDLRNNSGGYLETAIEVISQFIPEGKIMVEALGSGEDIVYDAIPGGLATKIPLVILVNEGSASASEITAGAIQDLGRGKLVGTTTYGKGSVQNWIPLENDQGAVKVTIARWLTPGGRQINGIGLTPDYVVELTEQDIAAQRDSQLQKAIELLLEK